MTKLIGLTGGIATGKSTVSNLLRQAGLPIIDADLVTRQLQRPGAKGLELIAATFGRGILNGDGSLNRKKLGRRVFNNQDDLAKLNRLMQPLVREAIDDQIDVFKKQGLPWVVLDIPLLFEAHYAEDCDLVVVVKTDPQTQLNRLMARNGYSCQEARERIAAQWPLANKVAQADWVIDNSGDRRETKKQVVKLLGQL